VAQFATDSCTPDPNASSLKSPPIWRNS
jgi:hypothetical protein